MHGKRASNALETITIKMIHTQAMAPSTSDARPSENPGDERNRSLDVVWRSMMGTKYDR